jgi:hypothetical protein
MQMFLIALFLILILITGNKPAFGQDTITIQGKVTIQGTTNLNDITIEIWLNGERINTVANTMTNNVGLYSISNVPIITGTDWYLVSSSKFVFGSKFGPSGDYQIIESSEISPGIVVTVPDMVLLVPKSVSFDWVYQPDGSTNLSSGELFIGSATLLAYSSSSRCGFIFATTELTGVSADLYFSDSGQKPYSFFANNGAGGVHDMGEVPLESVTEAPDASNGVGAWEFYNNQRTDVIIGHTYCVVTMDGNHYAKIYITTIDSDVSPQFLIDDGKERM